MARRHEREPRNSHGEFEKKGYRRMSEERREHHEEREHHERLNGRQTVGMKEHGVFGRRHDMGIQEYDREADKAGLTPLENRFSWMECSQEEAMRAVRGKGTSYEENRSRKMKPLMREEY